MMSMTHTDTLTAFNDLSSPAALMATRRSAKPRNLVAPGPDAAQLRRILTAATRVPDHGKLFPWHFVVIGPEQRDSFAALLREAKAAEDDDLSKKELAAIDEFATMAPTLIVAISRPDPTKKIPVWEQELSAGAACMNLMIAANAEGFQGGWLSEWPAYSETVRRAFTDTGRIAGFIFLGTSSRDLDERPRPEYDDVVSDWVPSPRPD
jgi:nitroreductase